MADAMTAEPSDTDRAAERSVFAVDEPGDFAPARASEPVASAPAKRERSERRFDPRRLLEEHPVAAIAIGVGAIGLGVVGYRAIRHSLPVRLLLALRFGRLRELWTP